MLLHRGLNRCVVSGAGGRYQRLVSEEQASRIPKLIVDTRDAGLSDETMIAELTDTIEALQEGVS
jgi:hypothetical protein